MKPLGGLNSKTDGIEQARTNDLQPFMTIQFGSIIGQAKTIGFPILQNPLLL
jgi:hypothetical protein